MDAVKGPVKHLVVLKFKDDTPTEKIEQFIKAYTNLVKLIDPLKVVQCGTDLGLGHMNQGFTHVFELSFDSVEDVATYNAHPAHLEIGREFTSFFENGILLHCKLTIVE